MQRRHFITCALGTSGLAAMGSMGWKATRGDSESPTSLKKISRSSRALGSQVHLTVYAGSRSQGNRAIDAALEAIEEVEKLMSLYRSDSQLCQLNRDGILHQPHPSLVQVLKLASDLSEQSEGAFDVTVQPLWELLSRHARFGTQPTAEQIADAHQRVGWRHLEISDSRIQLKQAAQITLNGIAQGHAADAARAALAAHGIEHAILDTGELSPLGSHIERDHWTVGIRHPRESGYLGVAHLDHRCLATSGDYESSFNEDLSSHHLFDPITGTCANACASVSVMAPTAAQADALSTACFVLGPERGLQLIESTPDTDALFVAKNGDITRSPNFPVELS